MHPYPELQMRQTCIYQLYSLSKNNLVNICVETVTVSDLTQYLDHEDPGLRGSTARLLSILLRGKTFFCGFLDSNMSGFSLAMGLKGFELTIRSVIPESRV